MAKRKTIQQKEIEKEIDKHLNELGRKITVISSRNSKVSKLQKSHLRDSAKYQVKPYNVLNVSQFKYGKWNTPKGQPTPPQQERENLKNTPLRNSIKDNTDDGIKVLIKEMTDLLKSPIVSKKNKK